MTRNQRRNKSRQLNSIKRRRKVEKDKKIEGAFLKAMQQFKIQGKLLTYSEVLAWRYDYYILFGNGVDLPKGLLSKT